jgi:hypothetical protein
MLGRDEETAWFAPDGRLIDGSISLFPWHEDDTMKIVHHEDGMFPAELSFRHATTRRTTIPYRQLEREAKNWVTLAWDVLRMTLRTRISTRSDGTILVKVMEQPHSPEQFDNVPLAYVWVRDEDNRRRQYRAQRAYDLTQQVAFDQNQYECLYLTIDLVASGMAFLGME